MFQILISRPTVKYYTLFFNCKIRKLFQKIYTNNHTFLKSLWKKLSNKNKIYRVSHLKKCNFGFYLQIYSFQKKIDYATGFYAKNYVIISFYHNDKLKGNWDTRGAWKWQIFKIALYLRNEEGHENSVCSIIRFTKK